METVSMTLPASPELIGVVRLVAAGLAARLQFSLEDIEDLKIAMDEMCSYMTGARGREGSLELSFQMQEGRIEIRGSANLSSTERVRTELTDFSRMILDTVTDAASLETRDGGPAFHVVKSKG